MACFAQVATLALLLLAQAVVGPSIPTPPKVPTPPSAEALAALRDKLKTITPESLLPPDKPAVRALSEETGASPQRWLAALCLAWC
jgi:hypothetical protein